MMNDSELNELISPKYLMTLVEDVRKALECQFVSEDINFYLNKWYESDEFGNYENFKFYYRGKGAIIDIIPTLHSMKGAVLLKIAVDLGVNTPFFIPSIPIFKNEIKSDYKTAYDTFIKAYKNIDSDPSIAVGLANSALESIIKEILKDTRISEKVSQTETLYKLTHAILKEFKLMGKDDVPIEIKTLGGALINVAQQIEKIRSEKTLFHGKTQTDYLIDDSIYSHLIINSVTTIGLFLNSYYKLKYPKDTSSDTHILDDLPF